MATREDTIRNLKSKRDELMAQMERLDKDIEHLNGAIALFEKEALSQLTLVSPSTDFPIGKLRNLTQLQAVIAIADHNGGMVRAQDAKRLLIRAGVMRETKNSTNITHNVIIRSKLFERVGPGEYRLKPASRTDDGKQFYPAPVQ